MVFDQVVSMLECAIKQKALVLVSSAALGLSACGQIAAQGAPATELPALAQPLGKPVGLAINGFNYTDLVIELFSVAYQGGGNIYVSSPTSGGGGTVCCVTWRTGTKLPKPIQVEWLRVVNNKDRWCRKTVMLTGPVPANPTAIGVHFMPDGDIQIELTEGEADPKLKLNRFDAGRRKEIGNVIHDEETASCKDGR
jgi:Protein of unknown function (DUF3304)